MPVLNINGAQYPLLFAGLTPGLVGLYQIDFQVPAGLPAGLRSDEQLVALFRSGHDEAFQVIYDRYHKRLAGYARQMLPRGHDPEDVLQDVFVRAYRALLHDNRELAVRPWLFRVAHNCCIDELRRTVPTPTDELFALPSPADDPAVRADARETLRRLIEDIGRLPEQQRSALLLRELSGLSYAELAVVLGTTVAAVKSLLVRARMGLVQADVARDTACSDIREQLVLAHDQGVRAGPNVRRHLQDCPGCRSYRGQMCVVKKRMAALVPAGPLAALARLIGLPGASATGTGSAAPVAALGAGGTLSGTALGASHVAALVAAAIATAGGAVGLEHVIVTSGPPLRNASVRRVHHPSSHGGAAGSSSTATLGGYQAEPSTGSDSASGAETGAAGGGGNAPATTGTATADGGTGTTDSPTPTVPPGWSTTGPTPTVSPSTGDTGPTPPSAGGDGSSGTSTPTTDTTGPTPTTGDSSGASGSTSTGSTASTTGTPTTDTGTSSTTDPNATTASASDGSTSTDSGTTSSGSSSSGSGS